MGSEEEFVEGRGGAINLHHRGSLGTNYTHDTQRVKSAAANVIKKKWGYSSVGHEMFPGAERITLQNFMKDGTLKEDHKQLMERMDSGLEKVALKKEAKKHQEYLTRTTNKGVVDKE